MQRCPVTQAGVVAASYSARGEMGRGEGGPHEITTRGHRYYRVTTASANRFAGAHAATPSMLIIDHALIHRRNAGAVRRSTGVAGSGNIHATSPDAFFAM
jgi:hypothetical protein